jgi:riboflavin kinase/FMN adenylyltransferase
MNPETYRGIVIHGDGYGRKLGYPTANIEIKQELSGVFLGGAEFEGKKYRAAIFASDRRPILEAHILDFDGDLYGKEITVTVGDKIREAAVFHDEAILRTTIQSDIEKVRARFSQKEHV